MKVAFDLDGTLDRPAVRDLALALLQAGHDVHVISGCFKEAGDWQDHPSKYQKLVRLGLLTSVSPPSGPVNLHTVILDAVDAEEFDREYRLVDLGLRKGAYLERNGITLMFEDSDVYCKTIPAMCGAQVVQVLR